MREKLKQCSKCKKKKPLSEFYKDKSMVDGYKNFCKKCENQQKNARIKCQNCGKKKPIKDFNELKSYFEGDGKRIPPSIGSISKRYGKGRYCKECEKKLIDELKKVGTGILPPVDMVTQCDVCNSAWSKSAGARTLVIPIERSDGCTRNRLVHICSNCALRLGYPVSFDVIKVKIKNTLKHIELIDMTDSSHEIRQDDEYKKLFEKLQKNTKK